MHGCDAPEKTSLVGTVAQERPLGRLPALTRADADAGILGRFRRVTAALPDVVAVSDDRDRLSFARVAELAASVSDAVRTAVTRPGAAPVRPSDGAPGRKIPVALLHGHPAEATAAALGIIGSGHPLLVLDPRTPPARLRGLVDAARARLVVCDPASEEIAAGLAPQVVVVGRDTAGASAEQLWADPPDVDAIAVLWPATGGTGGTGGTGRTAGERLVWLDHRTTVLEAYGRAVVADGFRAGDRIATTMSLASAAGLLGTLAALLVGAETCLYDVGTRGIDGFGDWAEAEAPSVLCTDPPRLRALLRTWPWKEQFAGLRSVVISGEAAYPREVEPLRALLPADCVLHHWYAAEDGRLLADHALRAEDPTPDGALPAGRPVGDRKTVVVDDGGRPVPAGDTGRITTVMSGPDGSRTYRTGDVGRLDADGVLHVVGRVEDAVTVAGLVVHPAEADAALFALTEVREAVVLGEPEADGQAGRLVAYVVPDADQPSAAKLRAALRGVLPTRLVPEAVVYLDVLPRTEAGRIDRWGLPPAPPRSAAGPGVPLTSMEVLVSRIWAEVLELDQIGRNEDFFELGGDSLSAEALISRVVSELGADDEVCNTSMLIEAPTVAEFAARLRGQPTVRRGPLVPLHRGGSRPPLFIMAGAGGLGIAFVPWARLLGPDQPTWALQCAALESRGLPDRSVRSIARTNVAAIRTVAPRGPYHLAGYSFGGLVALEMAHQLKAAGEQVGLLALIDSFPPEPTAQPPLPRRAPIQKVRDLAGVTLLSALSTPGGRDHWRFQDHAARLARRYTAAPWDGRALVLVGESEDKNLRARWAPHLTGPWRRVDIPGDHLSITRLPWAATVAEALAAELDAARR